MTEGRDARPGGDGRGSGANGRGSGRETRVSPELARLRTEIDDLDRRIVGLINERNELVRAVGHEKLALGRRYVRDRQREREVLLRVSMANTGPTPQADLLSIFRRLIASARGLETVERDRLRRDEEGPAEPPSA
ncbi:MAG TPA: chorismate mutase [Candidatus Limnocylindrales bacterium]|nr:chorismate mutase [Candidatus Limnocylindrales bacterium]